MNLEAERAYVEELRQQWLAERAAEKKLIAECNVTKTTPPRNHWEAAHHAEKRFMMALNVLTVLEGV